jgi:Methyltransferase domain
MESYIKPQTQKPNKIKKWLRIKFLSPYLRNISKDEKSLDLACGYGFSFSINPNFYGVDLDDDGVKFCKKKGFNVIKADILQYLPFPEAFFHNCFSHDVLEHFDLFEVETIFKNVHKVLCENGTFLNIIPNRLGYDLGLKTNAGHKHFINVEEIRGIAQKTGFQFIKEYSSPFPAFFHHFFAHNKFVTVCKKTNLHS